MRLRSLVTTWVLSVLPLAVGWWTGGELVLGSALQSGLVLLPWLFTAGLPRRADAAPRHASLFLALMAPPVALAAGLDLAEGVLPLKLLLLVGAGIVFSLLLFHAAEQASRRGERVRLCYAWSWLLLVPVSAALLFLQAQAALPGIGSVAAVPPAWMQGVSPLALLHALTREAQPSFGAWGVATCSVVVLVALASLGATRGKGEARERGEVDGSGGRAA